MKVPENSKPGRPSGQGGPAVQARQEATKEPEKPVNIRSPRVLLLAQARALQAVLASEIGSTLELDGWPERVEVYRSCKI